MSDKTLGFKPSELRLGSEEWKSLSEERAPHLRPETREWLGSWEMWNLACSPMSDDERRLIRYGHYLGWHDRLCWEEEP